MSKVVEVYVLERDAMLKKFDIIELDKFIERWHEKKVIEDYVYNQWQTQSDTMKMCVLCKMICNIKRLPKSLKEKARKWLEENQYSQDLQ